MQKFDVRHKTRDQNEINRSIANRLVRDIDVPAERVQLSGSENSLIGHVPIKGWSPIVVRGMGRIKPNLSESRFGHGDFWTFVDDFRSSPSKQPSSGPASTSQKCQTETSTHPSARSALPRSTDRQLAAAAAVSRSPHRD